MSLIIAFFVAYFVWLFIYALIGGVKRYKLDRAIERLPQIEDPEERKWLLQEDRRRKRKNYRKRYGIDE